MWSGFGSGKIQVTIHFFLSHSFLINSLDWDNNANEKKRKEKR